MKKYVYLNTFKRNFFEKIFKRKKLNNEKLEILNEKENDSHEKHLSSNDSDYLKPQQKANNVLEKLEKNEVLEKKELKKSDRYELYKDNQPTDILQKDPEFGDVVKYSDFLEEGKEKFDNVLTKYFQENKHLENNKQYKELMKIVDEKSKMFYSNYKEEYKYNLASYEERWYKDVIYSRKTNDFEKYFKKEDPLKKRAPELVNKKKLAKEYEEIAYEPVHPTYPTPVKTPFETISDRFQWLCNLESKETKKFMEFEMLYSNYSLFKYNTIESVLIEDFLDFENNTKLSAVQISKNFIFFKKSQDDITLYKVENTSVEPSKRGFIDENDLKNKDIKIVEVFGLRDFIQLNERFTDTKFLDFARRLLDSLEQDRDTLIHFTLCPKEQYLVLFFDMQGDMKSFDILIKDLKNDILLPIAIYNSDGHVAFDNFDGLFYTQLDMSGRPNKTFRHQIGKSPNSDVLIYFEKNNNFKLRTYNCNSREMVYIEVSTNNTQNEDLAVNEIWFKPTNDLDKIDFTCIKKIEKNINYQVKYYNGAFYLLINKSDSYDKSLKRIRAHNPKIYGLLEHSKIKTKEESKQSNSLQSNITKLSDIKDLDITQKEINYNKIDIYQEAISNNQKSLVEMSKDLIKFDDNVNIINFEIFKNFLVVLEEINGKRKFKIFNLLTNNYYIHEPELDNMNVKLIDNFVFDSSYFRYAVSSPTIPSMMIDYSMGTRKSYNIHFNSHSKYEKSNYKTQTIYVEDREKETKIPVILSYKEDLFNTESPIIMYTKGSLSSKENLEFNDLFIPLMDKGFAFAIPQIRGTKFFDFNWYEQGIAENKFKHFTDFIDVAFYFKEKNLSENLILFGDGYSGGLTSAVAFTQNPTFFNSAVFLNSAFDVIDLCQTIPSIPIIEEFGDVKVRHFYEMMKIYSPYHSLPPISHCPILIANDTKNRLLHHSLKFTGKLRNKNKSEGRKNKIYLEIMSNRPSIEEQYAFLFSFIIGETYQMH